MGPGERADEADLEGAMEMTILLVGSRASVCVGGVESGSGFLAVGLAPEEEQGKKAAEAGFEDIELEWPWSHSQTFAH